MVFAALFAPAAAVAAVLACLIMLSIVEFALLMRRKKPRVWSWDALDALGFLFGAGLIASGLWTLAKIPAMYGDAACGPFRLGNVMLLYVIAIVKFSDVGGFAFGLTSAKLMTDGVDLTKVRTVTGYPLKSVATVSAVASPSSTMVALASISSSCMILP